MTTNRSTLIGRVGAARAVVLGTGALTALGAAVAIGLGSGATTTPAGNTAVDHDAQQGAGEGQPGAPWISQGGSGDQSPGQQDFGHAQSSGS